MKVLFYPSILDVMFGRVAAEWHRQDASFAASAIVSGRRSADDLTAGFDGWRNVYPLSDQIGRGGLDRPADHAFLRSFEREFAPPNLNLATAADRFVSTGPAARSDRMVELTIRVLQQIWSAERPAAVVSEGISDLPSYILWAMCRSAGLPFVFLVSRGVDGRSGIVDNDRDSWPLVESRFAEIQRRGLLDEERSAASRYVQAFRDRPEPPGYIQALRGPRLSLNDAGRLRAVASAHARDPFDPNYVSPARAARNRLRRVARASIASKWMFDRPKRGEPYVLFPLQLQPEMTTSVLAPFYVDQIATVQYVAKAVPAGHVLWVKEHPYSVGRRALSDYRRLRGMSKVRLIHPGLNTFELTRHAAAVVTISSTLGWEALLLGVPVVTLGNVFVNACPLVRHVSGFHELYAALDSAVEQAQGSNAQDDLLAFVTAMLQGTYPGEAGGAPADFPRSLEPENVKLVTASLRAEISRLTSAPDRPQAASASSSV